MTATASSPTERQPELVGQTVVVIGGSSGIGFETARRARSEGADVVLTGRDPTRLQRAGKELGALSTAAFDATDPAQLEGFFQHLPDQVDHVMVTAGGAYYAPLADMDFAKVRQSFDQHLFLPLDVARHATGKVRPGGTLVFMTGISGRRAGIGLEVGSILDGGLPALTADLALELAPIRVNLIAAGFVDTPLSASVLGHELGRRRNQLQAELPIRRVVKPADVAALAVHLMTNTALTGTTYDIDGGEQLVSGA